MRISQTKALTRFQFATYVPRCAFDPLFATATSKYFQGMWVVPNEEGWGINFTHQGEIWRGVIFATWFIYDSGGNPTWVSATLVTPHNWRNYYSGTIDATTGPPFESVPFDPSRVTHRTVGTAALTVTDGDGANATLTFTYTLNGVSQTKAITRFVFREPGTVCY